MNIPLSEIWFFILVMIFIGFSIGLMVGAELMGHKWKNNAKRPYRLEYKGKLYKVIEEK